MAAVHAHNFLARTSETIVLTCRFLNDLHQYILCCSDSTVATNDYRLFIYTFLFVRNSKLTCY